MATLRFLGAAGTVTGSRYLLQTATRRVLVDCGLFQGYKQLRLRNWARFPVPPASIDALVLTHAHLDHCGYLPRLVKAGFTGPVHCTQATRELCEVLLLDSGRLQEEEAEYATRKRSSRHEKPLPLYSEADARACLKAFRPVDYFQPVSVSGDLSFELRPAGHLLGAAQVRFRAEGCTVHFSGDLGRDDDAILPPPMPLHPADVVVCESTYGNRRHARGDASAALAEVVDRVIARRGVVLIPAFAVGRAQAILHQLDMLRAAGRIPEVPIYLNSPMAQAASRIHARHSDALRIPEHQLHRLIDIAREVRTVEESRALNQRQGPMIILSASGMLTGGRILHHVAAFGPDARNAIVLAGFQAGGTRGARLAAGERSLRIFGQTVPIEAEVVQLEGMSAHADADGLMHWLSGSPKAPRNVYVTHGEPDAADALRYRIQHELGWPARVPEHLEEVELETMTEGGGT